MARSRAQTIRRASPAYRPRTMHWPLRDARPARGAPSGTSEPDARRPPAMLRDGDAKHQVERGIAKADRPLKNHVARARPATLSRARALLEPRARARHGARPCCAADGLGLGGSLRKAVLRGDQVLRCTWMRARSTRLRAQQTHILFSRSTGGNDGRGYMPTLRVLGQTSPCTCASPMRSRTTRDAAVAVARGPAGDTPWGRARIGRRSAMPAGGHCVLGAEGQKAKCVSGERDPLAKRHAAGGGRKRVAGRCRRLAAPGARVWRGRAATGCGSLTLRAHAVGRGAPRGAPAGDPA